jgi:hypothetical protein
MERKFTLVYVIYDADVKADGVRFIERMSPACHLPAGHNGSERDARTAVAAKFTQTEGNDRYDFGYLGDERNPRDITYYPYKCLDSEGLEVAPDDCEVYGLGQHRKWTAELTRAEWLMFADDYLIVLDDEGIPERHEDTLGSLTVEYGAIPAICVDNREGWEDSSGGVVISSQMYLSFGVSE